MLFHDSAWSYTTAAAGGVGLSFLAVSGGEVILQDPSGSSQRFRYGGFGVGLAAGFRIPKVKLPSIQIKGKTPSGAGAAKAFPSIGDVYRANASSELTRSDIQGATVFLDASAGLIVGVGGAVMLLGINPFLLSLAITNPALINVAMNTATAVLLMVGLNVGLQAGAGIGGLVGYLG